MPRRGHDDQDDEPIVDLYALGGRVRTVSMDNERVLIELPLNTARRLFSHGVLDNAGPQRIQAAVERELESIRRRSPDLADSALAASAMAMAFEIEQPFNSATSKSQCARAMQGTLRELRELAPPEEARDAISKLSDEREERRSRG